MVLSIQQLSAMAGLLLFGGITTVSQNDYLQFTTTNFPNYIGKVVAFNYPWFGNFLMFLAMVMLCFLWIYQSRKNGSKPRPQYETVTKQLFSSAWICLIFSSIFDLVASGMMSVGLFLGVPPSVYQMLNGSIVIFTPLLSFFFLKHKITLNQGIGMVIVITGLITVALSSWLVQLYFSGPEFETNETIFTKSNSGFDLFLGIILIVASQMIYAAQFVLEEHTMKNLDCLPAQVVCVEGIYGLFLTMAFVMPVFDLIGAENDFDAFVFLGAEPLILIPVLLFFVTVAIYNAFGQTVTKLISANHRTIMEGLRALTVWIFSLLERAIFKGSRGEGLHGWASAIQAVGFVIQLVGSFVFYEIIKLKKCQKQQTQEPILDENQVYQDKEDTQ